TSSWPHAKRRDGFSNGGKCHDRTAVLIDASGLRAASEALKRVRTQASLAPIIRITAHGSKNAF
ncbi:hypothetical protein, partial [Pseudomonas viridiflava]|uniref:hypothetical protein n=1 Tax=Pseudomonas viridiflava TaxID=33069 RepID=UPI0019801BB6